jgi:hypothetical protein
MIPTDKSKSGSSSDPAKPIEKVYIAGTMTGWRAIEMVRTKGDAYFCVIIDCYEGDVYYKFCVDGDWTIDYSMVNIYVLKFSFKFCVIYFSANSQ